MGFKQQFSQALVNIFAAKLRSLLAVLGILVGTASVVALVTSGQLATQKALKQFKFLGTDLLAIALYNKSNTSTKTQQQEIQLKQITRIPYRIDSIRQIAPYSNLFQTVSFQGHPLKANVIGATHTLQSVINIRMQHGNFISPYDSYEKVCVIGSKLKRQIEQFTRNSPIGMQLNISGQFFTIIGVAKPWQENAFFNDDINAAIVIPLPGLSALVSHAKVNHIILSLYPNTNIDDLIEQLKTYIHQIAPELNVFPRSAKQIISSMQKQGKIFTLLLAMIGGISLLVGGIGVMNVMLVAVSERRKEIGIRLAIGARARDILWLFVIESISLSLIGGALGVVLGLGVANALGFLFHWGTGFFPLPIAIGFAVSTMTGVFFGFYPAYRASRLNPIITLRCD